MKEIGVWDCPRVIRSEKLKVMAAHSYSYLTVAEGVRCPTPSTDGVWIRYLSDISRRKVQTKSGADFYLKEISWIDGLEDETIRDVVVEAMLRRPEQYKPHLSTTLSRWSDEDRTVVPSLWVHAMRSEHWSVVPTSLGLRTTDTAWFLPPESRSITRSLFLACVRPEFYAARELLNTLDVVTLEEAGISRLVSALQELAERKQQVEPEALRHFSALANDLYEAIQVKLKARKSSNSLTRILDRPVPLLRGEQISCFNLNDIEQIYVDDDPVRRRFIDGFAERWVIPKRSNQSYSELIEALRGTPWGGKSASGK